MDNRLGIIVVDDDRDILDLIEIVLKMEGYQVRTAHDGVDALALYAERPSQLILLDMRMPGMDGWSFAREFRRLHDSETPLVVMSAAESVERRAAQVGAEGWMGKPFDLDELKAIARLYADPQL